MLELSIIRFIILYIITQPMRLKTLFFSAAQNFLECTYKLPDKHIMCKIENKNHIAYHFLQKSKRTILISLMLNCMRTTKVQNVHLVICINIFWWINVYHKIASSTLQICAVELQRKYN